MERLGIKIGALVRQNQRYLSHKFLSRWCGITDPENRSGFGFRSVLIEKDTIGLYLATEKPVWNPFTAFDLVLFNGEKVYCPLGLIEEVK